MNKAIEQSRGRQILLALAVWIVMASVLTAAGALFVSRMRLSEQRLGWVAGGIVLIAEFTAAAVLLRGRMGKRRLISALRLAGMTTMKFPLGMANRLLPIRMPSLSTMARR